ncbi:Retinoblastoma-like protein 1 [Halotydeus destructor]|nr:Retinoblastoma-like protein 1 [Halotydeus destructor]
MGLDVEDSDVSKRYKEVCADLNLDKHSADEAWQSFQRIGRNYTLEGDKLHWLACALYVSCRKGVTPTIGGRGGIEGNCVSLTRLLRSCRLSLVQFFNKMKKWSDMANLPHEMRNKIDHHERNFNVSTVIFKKFKPIFLNIFKDPSLSPTKPTKNRKQSRRQFVTSSEVFSFCWTLYIHVKAHFPQISDDLVNSYHLLLCCVDLCYSNAIVADNAKDLINPEFDALPEGFSSPDFKLPDKIGCIIQALCKKYDGMFVEAKGIKEHWWNSKVKRMIEREELKARKCEAGQPVQLLGLFDSSNFPFNLRSINKEYDRHVLNIGDFDERIFLCDNAHEELGTPQTSGDDVTIKTIMNQGLKKHMESTTSLMPSTPLSNRHYLKDKESALTATPVSSATHTVGQLHSLLLDRKPEPSEGLLTLFEECSSNPQQFIGTLITEIGQLFVTAYCQPATPEEEAEMPMLVQPGDFAKKRLELGVTLYYRCLENVMNREKKRLINSDKSKEALSNLLLQETMHVSLFACAMEIVLFSYNSQRTFPWIIDILSTFRNLNFQPFHFYKVIELIIRDEDGLSRSVVKHLNSLEEKILGSLAWKANSALWEAIKTQGTIPSCQDVALPNAPASEQKTILASPMAAGEAHRSLGCLRLSHWQLVHVGALQLAPRLWGQEEALRPAGQRQAWLHNHHQLASSHGQWRGSLCLDSGLGCHVSERSVTK